MKVNMYVIQNTNTKKFMMMNLGYLSLSNKFTTNLNEARFYKKLEYTQSQLLWWRKNKPGTKLEIKTLDIFLL
jgi:hypothetical protein